MKTRAAVALLAFATAFVYAVPAFAQEQTGTLTGQVTEEGTARPLPGVLVQVVGTRLAQTTNEAGRFMFVAVPAGTHTVTAEFLGFAEGRAAGVTVAAGETSTANIVLEPTALSLEEVVVTGVSEATTGGWRRSRSGGCRRRTSPPCRRRTPPWPRFRARWRARASCAAVASRALV